MSVHEREVNRVLLLMAPGTYRAGAFTAAAERVGLEALVGLDLPAEIAQQWGVALGFDLRQPEQAVEAIVEFVKRTPVRAILAVDDTAVVAAALASAKLGLRHNSPKAALAGRDKQVMRQLLASAGVPSAEFRPVRLNENPEQIAVEAPYPCVVKPTTLNASRGVIRANNADEFVAAFRRVRQFLVGEGCDPDRTNLLVESFIPGVEVALEGLLTDGELHVLALFDKPDPLDGPFFEETIYVTPSRLPEDAQAAIANCARRAAAAIGLSQGPVHAELRLNEAGPWLIELAGRSIGGHCSSILRFGTDVCLEELILRQAAGLELPDLTRERSAVGVMMIPIPGAGILKCVDGIEEAKAVPLIEDVEISAKRNYRLVPLPEGGSYLGFIFARGEEPAAVEAALRQAHGKLSFVIETELPMIQNSRQQVISKLE